MKFKFGAIDLLCPACGERMRGNVSLQRVRCLNGGCLDHNKAYEWPTLELTEVQVADVHPEPDNALMI